MTKETYLRLGAPFRKNAVLRRLLIYTDLVLTGLVYALGMVAMFLIFCEPVEDSEHWLLDLMLSKAGAVLAGWGAWRLSKKL